MSVGNIAPRPAIFRIGCLLDLNLGKCSGFGEMGFPLGEGKRIVDGHLRDETEQ